MKRRVVPCLALVALFALPAADQARAAGRGEAVREPVTYEVDDEVGDPAVWTKRLVGRFRVDGSIHHDFEIIDHGDRDADPAGPLEVWDVSMQGKIDCIDFTAGAGLQCVLNVFWQEQWRDNLKDQLGGMPDLTPGMLLAGVTPSTPGTIRMLEVDRRGLAHPGSVKLGGYTARTELPCVNMPGTQKCEQSLRITAKPDSKLVFVVLSTTVRAFRSKLERKQVLGTLGNGSTERNMELYEERLVVSFSLRREPQPSEAPRAPAAKRSAQGSR
jgi:hypothetical protein